MYGGGIKHGSDVARPVLTASAMALIFRVKRRRPVDLQAARRFCARWPNPTDGFPLRYVALISATLPMNLKSLQKRNDGVLMDFASPIGVSSTNPNLLRFTRNCCPQAFATIMSFVIRRADIVCTHCEKRSSQYAPQGGVCRDSSLSEKTQYKHRRPAKKCLTNHCGSYEHQAARLVGNLLPHGARTLSARCGRAVTPAWMASAAEIAGLTVRGVDSR